MTELEALAKVEAAARVVARAWREDTDIGPPLTALREAISSLDWERAKSVGLTIGVDFAKDGGDGSH